MHISIREAEVKIVYLREKCCTLKEFNALIATLIFSRY